MQCLPLLSRRPCYLPHFRILQVFNSTFQALDIKSRSIQRFLRFHMGPRLDIGAALQVHYPLEPLLKPLVHPLKVEIQLLQFRRGSGGPSG